MEIFEEILRKDLHQFLLSVKEVDLPSMPMFHVCINSTCLEPLCS